MAERVKFIRKIWAKLNLQLDRIPKIWLQIAGYLLLTLAFGITIYELLIVGIFFGG